MYRSIKNYLQTGDLENIKDVFRLVRWHLFKIKWSDVIKNILTFILMIILLSFLLLNILVIASVNYEANVKGTSYIEEFKNHPIVLSNLEVNEK